MGGCESVRIELVAVRDDECFTLYAERGHENCNTSQTLCRRYVVNKKEVGHMCRRCKPHHDAATRRGWFIYVDSTKKLHRTDGKVYIWVAAGDEAGLPCIAASHSRIMRS